MASQLPPPTADEIRLFLESLRTKMDTHASGVWRGVRIAPRRENQQALFELDITAEKRLDCIYKLDVRDACQLLESDYAEEAAAGRRLWVFGIKVKKKWVYVKIQFGTHNEEALCISFHPARYPLSFLF